MRKIKITDSLRKGVENFNTNLFTNTRTASFEKPIDRLNKLIHKIKLNKHNQFKLYVEKIINEYGDILNADPSKMKSLISEFDLILDNSQLTRKINSKKYSFHEEVVHAMRYEDLRDKEFPEYLLNSDIRTCVYCNSQSTLSIQPIYYKKEKKKRKKILAKLQLDHYHPKSKYPFLCTSFFNLYPTCANCNLAKGKDDAKFELYTIDDNLDIFQFWIDDKSIIDYWLLHDPKVLKIYLDTIDGDFELLQNHNDLFQIQKIYDAQIDVGEELVWKHKANPETYRKLLNKTFNKIFHDKSLIDRMIIGNYSKPEEVHKRPMAKYTQDIARQLKLVK
ncbi:HNH endonuclease domain-containing protein [Aquimarina litoralis]|uniref:HNH endonuclease domain-containing protein n=1 Tax=Aquimarina litoralis TaxID=584605 RepID=A0ABN1IVL4_9FLAO